MACFQSLKPLDDEKILSVPLEKNRQLCQKAASASTEYSSHSNVSYHLGLNDLFFKLPNEVAGKLIPVGCTGASKDALEISTCTCIVNTVYESKNIPETVPVLIVLDATLSNTMSVLLESINASAVLPVHVFVHVSDTDSSLKMSNYEV